jgi:penicillin-binding protein 2
LLSSSTKSLDHRLRWLFAAFVALLLTVYGRLIALEVHDGGEYRAAAAEPIIHRHRPPAMRGRILAHDGTVLAYDEPLMSLALQYHWLEEPADPRWLRQMARSRLSAAQRRNAKAIAAQQEQILAQRRDLAQRLAALCGLTDDQWQARCRQIQQRVETIAAGVNARQSDQAQSKHRAEDDFADDEFSFPGLVGHSIVDALFALDSLPPTPRVTVAEEQQEHIVCGGLPLETVVEIETHPQQYPGVKLVPSYRRVYPQGPLAAHVLGYLGAVRAEEIDKSAESPSAQFNANAADNPNAYQSDDLIGRSGIERQYESLLRSRRGLIVDRLDARGQLINSTTLRQPTAGHDVVLTIDPKLQRAAQSLLDQALARRLPSGDESLDRSCGGAMLVIDVHTGAVLASASGPRFDPNAFVGGDSAEVRRWLADAARPLLDRSVQMALPPGSVFKIISACALLAGGVDPRIPVDCQGYLHQPEALRCAVFKKYGVGHGPVTLTEAMARSCNVYFFHHAEYLGAAPILDWAQRLGLGAVSGIDLPGEVAGGLPKINPPNDDSSSAPAAAKSQQLDPRPLAIGQGTITTTPLQMARMVAAIANGGFLVSPHVAQRSTLASEDDTNDPIHVGSPRPVPDLNEAMLAAIRKGLRQVVADEQGTAHDTVEWSDVPIAGKTGTAETGGGRPDHAWFAGYAPADQPRVAFVVVLEHAGDAATAAGPVVKLLVERMAQIGYFPHAVADR